MGYRFSLVLNREVDEQETAALREAICADASFAGDQLPTDAAVPVTKIELDDETSPTLADAIQAAFDAVHTVDGLTIPGLSVPAQPGGPETADAAAGADSEVVELAETVDAVT